MEYIRKCSFSPTQDITNIMLLLMKGWKILAAQISVTDGRTDTRGTCVSLSFIRLDWHHLEPFNFTVLGEPHILHVLLAPQIDRMILIHEKITCLFDRADMPDDGVASICQGFFYVAPQTHTRRLCFDFNSN